MPASLRTPDSTTAASSIHVHDLSPGGLYVTVSGDAPAASGGVLGVSIEIPWKHRRAFPFLRISGFCRIVRVDEVSTRSMANGRSQGVALALCEDRLTMLGAAVVPVLSSDHPVMRSQFAKAVAKP